MAVASAHHEGRHSESDPKLLAQSASVSQVFRLTDKVFQSIAGFRHSGANYVGGFTCHRHLRNASWMLLNLMISQTEVATKLAHAKNTAIVITESTRRPLLEEP